jgi:uncharacterized protein YbbC (DUF1343 family)/beta-glucosidase-like glycosyl hydrolase
LALVLFATWQLATGCRSGGGATANTVAGRGWVDRTLATLTLEQKTAQLLFVRAAAIPEHPDSEDHRALVATVRELGVGGVVLFRSELDSIPILLDELQAAAPVPLLVAADLERGLSFRVPDGPVSLPIAMAIGAIADDAEAEAAARFAGEVTGREARAVGIHWTLAPVADVNNDPRNPVINLRSFGERPDRVARLVAAWIAGARSSGVLTTAKHFPGHGDTALDSHFTLPRIDVARERLDAVELVPFRAAIAAGVDSVMTGHLWVPALDPGRPSSLSRPTTTTLLREELGFGGLVATDAMDMRGVDGLWLGAAVVEAVRAGADAILLPPDPRVAVQSLVRAVEEGELTEDRIDESVRRLLRVKERLGLGRSGREAIRVDRAALRSAIGRPADEERARDIARAAVTVVRNRGGVLPLRAETPLRLLHLVLSADWSDPMIAGIPEREFARRRIPAESRRLGPQVPDALADEIVAAAPGFTHVVVTAFVRVGTARGHVDMDPTHARLVERLAGSGVPVVLLSFGSPYLLGQAPGVQAFLATFGSIETAQRAGIEALLGEIPVRGRMPVSLPGVYAVGEGLTIERHAMTLEPADPAAAGFRADGLAALDRVIEDFRARGAFPGGVVAVGRRGRLAHLRAFGTATYAPDSPAVTTDTIYDLASLTKVLATTTVAMSLVDEGRLDLDRPVRSYLPGFRGPGKDAVTVRQLLSHSSGVDWWAPLYKEGLDRRGVLRRIQEMDLVYAPGTESKYSDLGILLLGEILERVAGRPLEELARARVFAPLGMQDATFRPPAALRPRIAPTERDPWRGRLVHGEVHDENAFALGGVAPHAGLFATARDVARFAQMVLNGGVFEHRRVVSRSTLAEFTARAGVPGSTRALGWDTRSDTGSSAGALFSSVSFGHTGFTGTSLWIDPARELFVVLLTNRVHPTRENNLIREARAAVADAAVRALVDPAEGLVAVGLDRVVRGEVGALAGKRLGLVAHAASVAADGRHALEVLRGRGLDVVRLFSPEHGWSGAAAAGETVTDGVDAVSGLPVLSLYGERRRPAAEHLADLDALVVDLQDAGVRFYTYAATLWECLEAAAEAGIEIYVLDRPNPLGGERVEGPLAAPREVVPASPVNRAPGPLVHGLTLGEMARYWAARRERPPRLTVIAMSGWRRAMTWRDTGRPWIAPSPNLRSADAALAYPGTALLEATNVSEGRGSEAPFLLVGAPWIDGGAMAPEVAGFRLTPSRFTPRASPAAPDPKHLDQECSGWRVSPTDGRRGSAYELGLALLAALRSEPEFEWRREGRALAWLLGTPRPGDALRAGATPQAIAAADRADHEAWRAERRALLLYE